MMEQLSLFDFTRPKFEINNKIRLIECFAGYGSQSMALKRLGADFEYYRMYEIDRFAVDSFNAVHGTNFETTDIKTVKGVDMGIVDKEHFTYLLTHFHAQIFLLRVTWRVWLKELKRGRACCGKSKGYSLNCPR